MHARDGFVYSPAHVHDRDWLRVYGCFGPLWISGNVGTGKRALVRRIHEHLRPDGALVVLACDRGYPDAIEDAIFGEHGPRGWKHGAWSRAHRGTLLFENVHALPFRTQRSLLRVLEGGRFFGDPGPLEVAFAATTWRDAGSLMADVDLEIAFHSRFPRRLDIAPLRERRPEIPWLVDEAARRAWVDLGETPRRVCASLVEWCCLHDWRDANIRELMDTVAAAVHTGVRRGSSFLGAEHLR